MLPPEIIDKIISMSDLETAIIMKNKYAINQFYNIRSNRFYNKFYDIYGMNIQILEEDNFPNCVNLSEFNNIKFYYYKNKPYKVITGEVEYYVADNGRYYVYENHMLNPGIHYGKFQCWVYFNF